LAQLSPLPLHDFLHCALAPFCRYGVITGLEEQLLLLGYFNTGLTLATTIAFDEMKTHRPLANTPSYPSASYLALPLLLY